jgi:hypothetical protein
MRLLATALAALTLGGGSGSLQVAFVGSGHAPKIDKHWPFSVRATVGGRPAKARLTLQIVDPIGGVHPVERGPTTQKIVNWPFTGVYRDYMIFPPESRDIQLKLRATVKSGPLKKVVTYVVTPHA